jgi:hypothetical protein
MTFDPNRLKFGDLIAAGGAVVLLISLFLEWYNVSVEGLGGFSGDVGGGNAFDALGIGPIFLLLVSLAVIAIVVMRALAVDVAGLPLPLSTILLILGALATLYCLFRLLITPGTDAPDAFDDNIDVGRSIGVFLAFLASLAIAAGAFLSGRERGEAIPGVGAGTGAGGGPLGGGQPGGPLGGGQQAGGQPYGGTPAAGQPGGGTAVQTPTVGDPAAGGGGATQAGGEAGGGPAAGGSPKADWYPDPEGKARLRYWDGTQWTDQTAD